MAEQSGGGSVALKPLILVPAVITFAITLLRLVGELLEWSPRFFSREPGGAAALVGIVWLVPIFGAYFAAKLIKMGHDPSGAGPVFGWAFLGLLAFIGAGFLGRALGLGGRRFILLFAVASILAIVLAYRGWPALGRVLIAYGLAARVPVAALMLVAILANWGTHYEKGPPSFPKLGAVMTWFWIGLVPQLTLWIGFTVVVGALCGGVAALVTRRSSSGS